ncbi:MAG: hypothetical protein ACHQ51_08760 [Elusimicrobiota bacterium]
MRPLWAGALVATLAVPAFAQEHGAGFAALLGRAEPGVETRATVLPGAAGGTPSMVSEEARASYVVARSSADEWTVLGKAGATELGRAPVVIPQSGFGVPTKLWNVQAGANYSRRLGDRRGWGVGAGAGSASDVLFHSIHETDLSLAARYELPSRERNSWVLLLNYSNNRTFLNNVPLPGFAYVMRDPDRGLTAVVGFPFALARWKPDENWSLSASVFGGSSYNLEAARRVRPATLYARLQREPQQWLRAGRADNAARLIYDEKDVRAGVRAPLGAGLSLDASAGWSFDRRFSEARDANRSALRAPLRNAAVIGAALSWRP